jgi:hypothetical protein
MRHLNTSTVGRHRRATRPETRLVLPTVTDGHDGDDVLKSLIDSWLVPRLLHEFVWERALNLGVNGVEPRDKEAADHKRRAA